MQMPSNFLASVSNNPDLPENMTATLREQFVQWLISVKEYGKPFALWCSTMDRQEMELVEMLEARSLPVFQSSDRAVQAFSAMYRYGAKDW
jgi:acyl-CoA synthetase (NDP forming)